MLSVAYHERIAIDKKGASRKFLMGTSDPSHVCQLLSHVIDSYETKSTCLCEKHHRYCDLSSTTSVRPHMCVIGFPCSPYSQQRARWKEGWEKMGKE